MTCPNSLALSEWLFLIFSFGMIKLLYFEVSSDEKITIRSSSPSSSLAKLNFLLDDCTLHGRTRVVQRDYVIIRKEGHTEH